MSLARRVTVCELGLAVVLVLLGLLVASGTALSTNPLPSVRTFKSNSRTKTLNLLMIARAVPAPNDWTANDEPSTSVWVYDTCTFPSLSVQRRNPSTWWKSCNLEKRNESELYHGTHLSLNRGDVLRIRLVNALPDVDAAKIPTNLHTHGLVVSTAATRRGKKLSFGDYMFVQAWNGDVPSSSHDEDMYQLRDFIDYYIRIPKNHPKGLFWFHPHINGMTQNQIDAGLSGIITVGSIEDTFSPRSSEVATTTRVVPLLLRSTQIDSEGQRMFLPDPLFCTPQPSDESDSRRGFCTGVDAFEGGRWLFTVNGGLFPTIKLSPSSSNNNNNDIVVFRIVQSLSSVTFELDLVPVVSVDSATGRLVVDESKPAVFQLLAVDGITVDFTAVDASSKQSRLQSKAKLVSCGESSSSEAACVSSVYMMPSSRVDLALNLAQLQGGMYVLRGRGPLMGWDGDEWPSINLALVEVPPSSSSSSLLRKQAIPSSSCAVFKPIVEDEIVAATKGSQASSSKISTEEEEQVERGGVTPCRSLTKGHKRVLFFGVPPKQSEDEEEGFGLGYEEWDAQNRSVEGTRVPIRLFDHSQVTICTKRTLKGEEWILINLAGEMHNFHIHQTKFQVLDPNMSGFENDLELPMDPTKVSLVDNVPLRAAEELDGQMCETIQDFHVVGNKCKTYLVHVRVPLPEPGDYVYHCHISEHSDNGMMARIRVRP